MTAFSDVVARIADDAERTDLTTQIKKAINRAIHHYEKERFYFNEATNTFSTVASQNTYTSSDAAFIANIAEIDLVKVTLSATNIPPLTKRSYTFLQEVDVGAITGDPCDYAWYASKLWLYPTPNAVLTITVSGQTKYTELSADADTNVWTTDAEDLIEARARWWLYKRVILDAEQASLAKEEELEALQALREKTAHLKDSGGLMPTEF